MRLALVETDEEIAPQIVVGHLYPDTWSTPYIRGQFDLDQGEHLLLVELWNPGTSHFAQNQIDVRHGIELLASSGPLKPEQKVLLRIPFELQARTEAFSISLRSRVEWQPPLPDKRSLGFVLLRWFCCRPT